MPSKLITQLRDPGVLDSVIDIEGLTPGCSHLVLFNMAGMLSAAEWSGQPSFPELFLQLYKSIFTQAEAVPKGGTLGFVCYDVPTVAEVWGE